MGQLGNDFDVTGTVRVSSPEGVQEAVSGILAKVYPGQAFDCLAGAFREISGVCTHPERQGRGWARRLVMELVRRQLRRGETPFLHVMSANTVAHDLYARMGFRDYREVVVRVIGRAP